MHQGHEMHESLPVRLDALQVHGLTTDLLNALGDSCSAREEQVPILERLQARAQIKFQELGQRHGHAYRPPAE
jgi:hypothetical protein